MQVHSDNRLQPSFPVNPVGWAAVWKGADLGLLDLFLVDALLGERVVLARARVACGRSSDATPPVHHSDRCAICEIECNAFIFLPLTQVYSTSKERLFKESASCAIYIFIRNRGTTESVSACFTHASRTGKNEIGGSLLGALGLRGQE